MKTTYCACVIQRVWVSRHSRARYNAEGGTEQTNHTPSIDNTSQGSSSRVSEFLRLMEAECIGEVVPPDQSWYVDRRRFPGQHPTGKKKVNGNMSAPGPQAFQPAARSLLRVFTGLVKPMTPPSATHASEARARRHVQPIRPSSTAPISLFNVYREADRNRQNTNQEAIPLIRTNTNVTYTSTLLIPRLPFPQFSVLLTMFVPGCGNFSDRW